MKTNRDMLAEAIAEAKMVKETAYENAKAALTETFAPHLKSMLSAKLQEMELEDESVEDETIPEADEMTDLDELLKEIESDEEIEEAKKDEETEETEEEAENEIEPEAEEELNIEDMSEEDLKSFIEDVINDMIETGELEPGEEHEHEENETPEEETEEHESGEEVIEPEELDEINIDNIEDDEINEDELGDDSVTDELDEAYKTIEELRGSLNEVKLLNAKLLYSNKIFQSKQLTEGKKLQVLRAFDKVTTVKEAKTTYELLKENLDSKKIVKEQFKGAASKTITPIHENKQPIMEVDNQYARWQILAGIKK